MNKKEARQLAVRALGELAEQLDRGLSDRLRQYLRAMRRFRAYSLGNTLLIMMQRPDATHVAGYRTWLALGRQVKRGEHGILILAPVVRRQRSDNDKDPQERERDAQDRTLLTDASVTGFRSTYVFDIAQTDGRDLPEFAQASGNPQEHLARLKQLIESEGITLAYHTSLDGADGRSSPGQILIRSGMMPAEEFSVLAHELAHHRMHLQAHDTTNHAVLETEAEAVAYVVCDSIGLSSNRSSADYIHLHQGDKALLLKSLQRIHRCAVEIIDHIQCERSVRNPVKINESCLVHPGPRSSEVTPNGPANSLAFTEPVMEKNHNSGHQRTPGSRPVAVVLQMWRTLREGTPNEPQSLEEAVCWVEWCVTRDVATGFVPIHEIVANALEVVSGEHDKELLRAFAEDLLRESIREHLAKQRLWPRMTDCDRLDAAFATLESAGIVCRHDYSCCGRCGTKEIRKEMAEQRHSGREVRGYAFYCVQDTQIALEGDELFLNCGSVLPIERTAIDIEWEIVATLREAGLKVDWDGQLHHRIRIGFDWKRRLPPSASHMLEE